MSRPVSILFRPVSAYSPVRSRASSFARKRGILMTKILIFSPFPILRRNQQQRIYQIPNPIKSTARMNHQKAEGKTRERMMINPAKIATKPSMQCRPLRITNRLPRRKLIAVYAGGGQFILFQSSLYSQNLCLALSS